MIVIVVIIITTIMMVIIIMTIVIGIVHQQLTHLCFGIPRLLPDSTPATASCNSEPGGIFFVSLTLHVKMAARLSTGNAN